MTSSPRNFDLPTLALRWSLIAIIWLGVVTFGLASLFYTGPYAIWIRQDLSCVLHTIGLAFSMALVVPRARVSSLILVALSMSCALEFLQLWHPTFLEVLRTQPLGRLVVGSAFYWSDFAGYAIGGAVAFGLLSLLPFPSPRPMAREARSSGALI